MKIRHMVAVTLLTALFSSYTYGTSLVYHGFECQNAVNADDTTTSDIPIQSKFDVIEEVGATACFI